MSGILMLNNKNYTATGNLRLGGIIVGTVPILVSNGVQRITLPIYGDEDIKINTTIYPIGNSGDTNIIGNEFTTSGWVLHFAGRNTLNFRYSSGSPAAFSSEPFTLREIEMATADGSLIVDGTTITSGHSTSYNHYPIQLFGINEGGTNYSYVGIGEMSIYKNNALFMHLLPRKDSNDHGYFYDEIGEQSYYSNTSDHLFYTEIKAN